MACIEVARIILVHLELKLQGLTDDISPANFCQHFNVNSQT